LKLLAFRKVLPQRTQRIRNERKEELNNFIIKIMTPRIEALAEKKLLGMRMSMSFANYKIAALWQSFMPKRREIRNNLSSDLISLAIYSPDHFENFRPTNVFERWAAVEVADFEHVPQGMDTYLLPAGLYAVFDYRGSGANNEVFQYIYGTWIPNSKYQLDNRPHFEVLGERYRNNDPESEEEIWIPVKQRET
jgi:AraC family transcriptional regulator